MMKNNSAKFLLLLAASATISMIGCQKDDDVTPSGDDPGNYVYADAFGAMIAIKTVTYTEVMGNVIPTELNTATAVFVSDAGGSTFSDAGSVKLNSKSLKLNANKSYVYDNFIEPLTFNEVKWEVEGKGNNPAISKTVNRAVPSYSGYSNLPTAVTKADGLTLTLGSQITQADSTLVTIHSGSKSVIKTVAGNAASISFTAAELADLANGRGMLQVTPYNITTETTSGRKYYFINQATYTRSDVSFN
jgi:hypothetical protein